MGSQKDAPLFEALKTYCRRGFVPFHTPGHRTRGPLRELTRPWTLDQTEIPDLDGASTQARRQEAEALAAEFFGAEATHFLVNGATEGVLALLLAIAQPGDEVIVVRDCHISVVHGMILAGLRPVFVAPDWVPGWSLPCLPRVERIRAALTAHPRAKAVWITHPSYAGVIGDLGPIAQVTHDAGLPLLIDEAHGGHLKWVGLSAPQAKDVADAWVHGTHKMMGSLTQTGLLHLRGKRIDRQRVRQALSWIRSTSPSYLLLCSIDQMRRFLADDGPKAFMRTASKGIQTKEDLQNAGIHVMPSTLNSQIQTDPMKLVVSWLDQGLTGGEAQGILASRYRLQPELVDRDHVVFFFSPMQRDVDLKKLRRAFWDLRLCFRGAPLERMGPPPLYEGRLEVLPKTASYAPNEWIPWSEAAWRIAAQTVAPYPPGIPLWCPGERITPPAIEWMKTFLLMGGEITGLQGEAVSVLKETTASYGIEERE